MSEQVKITSDHLRRCAVVYVRQSRSTQRGQAGGRVTREGALHSTSASPVRCDSIQRRPRCDAQQLADPLVPILEGPVNEAPRRRALV